MYKQKSKNRLSSGVPKSPFRWIKRKIILFISAIMIGMSNAIFDDDKSINGNQNRIEQQQDKD